MIGTKQVGVYARLLLWGLASILLLAAIPVLAQAPTGTILGVVKDTSGASVPNAAVTVLNVETGLTRTLMTGDDGAYRFPALLVGRYTVKAEGRGFKTEAREGLVLEVTQEAVVNFTLQVGETTEQVVVTGEAPLVNVTNSSLGGTVHQEQLAELPLNGRNYIDLVLLQKGTAKAAAIGNGQGTSGTWYSSNGAPMRSNNVLLDGARLNNAYSGASGNETGTTLGVDGIQEYKVITDSFSAEYGMSMGSQLVMVSKGGTNQFHGTAFEYLRNSALDARNFFDYPVGRRLPLFQRNNFGGSFGGPIKKNKTFFYAVYEGLRQNLGQSTIDAVIPANCYDPASKTILTTNNPCATASGGTVAPVMVPLANVYPYPNLPSNTAGAPDDRFTFPSTAVTKVNYGQIRVDQNFSASDTLFARYTVDQGVADTPINPGLATEFAGRNQFVTLSENHIFSPTVLNTARVSFSRTPVNAINLFPPQLTGPQYSGVPGQPIPTISVGNGTTLTDYGGITSLPAVAIQNLYTFSDDVNWTKGRHALKFGVLFNRFSENYLSGNSRGGLSFDDVPTFLAGIPAHFEATTPGSLFHRAYTFSTLGFYAQDDFRVTPRLTFNLGLRYEFNTVPSETHGNNYRFLNVQTDAPCPNNGSACRQGPIMRNPSLKNFSPRFGFAWDVTGKGTTSLRGGVGVYYDVGNIGSALKSQLGIPPISRGSSHQGGPVLTLPFTFTKVGGSSITTINYNIGQPHIVQYNLTVERQLPGAMALSVSYVGSRGFDLWTIREFNWNIPLSITNGLEYWGPGVLNYGGGPFVPNTSPLTTVNPNWNSAEMYTTGAYSWYNSLQAELIKRVSHGLQFQATYTYSQSLDTAQAQQYSNDCGINAPGSTSGVDPIFPINDKGPACTDEPHDFSLSVLYHFPNIKSANFAAKILHGWWVGNIVSIQSGLPFAPNTVGLISNSGVFRGDQGDRPNYVTAANLAAALAVNPNAVVYNRNTINAGGNASQWFNPNMFTLVGPAQTAPCPSIDPNDLASMCSFGYLGDASRDVLRGPGLRTWDFSLNKDTALPLLGEAGKLEFRAEFFNILNHANFGLPNGTIFAATITNETPLRGAGQILYTNTPSRQIQLGVKILF
jgi:carboxypeptidase family protein/TonB-dependent receptor-like protein